VEDPWLLTQVQTLKGWLYVLATTVLLFFLVRRHDRALGSHIKDLEEQREALGQSRRFLETLLDAIPAPVFYKDGAGRYKQVNQAFEDFFDSPAEDLLGKTVLDLLPSDEAQVHEFKDSELLRFGGSQQYEARLSAAGGVREVVFHKAVIASGKDGEPGLIGVILDITKRKRIEEALRESEQGYRTLFETMVQGVVYQDREGRIVSANPAAETILGLSREEIRERTSLDHTWRAIHEDGSEFPGETHPSMVALATGREIRNEVMGIADPRSGGYRWINIHATPLFRPGEEKPHLVYTTFDDVTERKLAQEALQEQEKALIGVLDATPETIVVLDRQGVVRTANQTVCRRLGMRREELIGRCIYDLFPEEVSRQRRERYAGVFESGETLVFEDSREGLEFEQNIFPVFDDSGQVESIVVFARDITQRKQAQKDKERLEAQLRQAHKMEAVGTLAGGIAHDFNNILAAISGYAELALQEPELDDGAAARLREILGSVLRAKELVRQILTFSRKASYKPRPLNFNQVVTETAGIIERTVPKMISLELHLEPGLQLINGDANQLEQLLLNLASNAKDAMPDGGRLIVETSNVRLDEAYVQGHLDAAPGNYVLVSVSDTGEGMDPETMGRVFEPFFTTKATGQGTGLGLSSAYGIVKSHEGVIYCYSEPGQGTTFKIYLPALGSQPQPAQADQERPGEEEAPGGSETVLVVDDERSLRDISSQVLESHGYRVLTAASGEEALEVYRQQAGEVDLVLLDLIMPGMGGNKALQAILALNPSARVVIASGYSANGHVKVALEGGAAGFLAKPYPGSELLRAVRRALDSPTPA
jgi:PAS domain S-box-containing protein